MYVEVSKVVFAAFNSLFLVDEEDFGLSVIGGLDGGTALYDGADVELHAIDIGRGLQLAALQQTAIHLVAVLLGIAILRIEADGRRGDVQLLTVGGDGHLRYHGLHCGNTL